MNEVNVSPKSRLVTLLLCLILGGLGAHRFYVGKIGTGLLMLFTLGGFGLWWLIDVILIVTGSFKDKEGGRVFRWTEPGSA
jgi:TM2 domain-containing membrane protein YozV